MKIHSLKQILSYMQGAAWKVEPFFQHSTEDWRCIEVTTPSESYPLQLHASTSEGRMVFSLVWPHGTGKASCVPWDDKVKAWGTPPRITLAGDTDAHKASRAITNRLMPEARRLHGLARAKLIAEEAGEVAQLYVTNQLCHIFHVPEERRWEGGETGGRRRLSGTNPNPHGSETWGVMGYGDFTVGSGGKVEINLKSLPASVAIKVARFLAKEVYNLPTT